MPNEIRDNLEHIFALAPSLKTYPNEATALAQTPGVGDNDIQAVAMLRRGQEVRNWLEGLPSDRRNDEWNRASNEIRSAASAAGYNPIAPGVDPPAENDDNQGGFSGFLDDVGDVAGKGLGVAKDVGSFGLHGLMWGRDQVAHYERANMDRGQQLAGDGRAGDWFGLALGWTGVGSIATNPAAFAAAWRRTEDGEKVYDNGALAGVRSQYSPEVFDIAKRIAEGESLDDLKNSAKTQEELDLFENAAHNPLVQEAVNAVNNSKLSVGRGLARAIGIDAVNNQKAFKYFSGTTDAVDTFFLDPLIVGSKVASTVKAGKYGLAGLSSQRIDELFDARTITGNQSVRRYLDGALPHINAVIGRDAAKVGPSYEALATRYKRMEPMLESLREYSKAEGKAGALDIDDMKRFFVSDRGMKLLVQGEAAYRGPLMPYKGLLADKVGDNLRIGIRKAGIGWFEKPSQLMNGALVGALDELEGGYRYTDIDPRALIPDFDTITKAERHRRIEAVRPQLLAEQERGSVYVRRIGDNWVATPVENIPSKTFLQGGVRSRTESTQTQMQGKLLAQLREQSGFLGIGKASRESRRYRTGMVLSRFVEQTPATRTGRLELDSKEAPSVIYNMARMYLPRWHANQAAGAFAGADLNGKMRIYKGLLSSLGEAAGVTRTDEGRVWMKRFLDEVDEGAQTRGYSAVRDNDKWADGGRHALYPHQMQSSVALPSFKEMHNFASRVGIMSRIGGGVTTPFLDWSMQGWRAGVLLRPALALRNALEENANHISKYGVWDWSQGMVARNAMDKMAKEYHRTGMVTDIEQRLTTGLRRVLGDDDKQFLREFSQNDDALRVYLDGIRDTSRRGMNNREVGEEAARMRIKRGGNDVEVRYRMTGNYRPQDTLDGDGVKRWTSALHMLLQPGSPARTALTHIDDHDTAIRKLTDQILSDGFKRNREYGRGWRVEGGAVDDPAAQAEAARIWAEKIFVDVRHHFSDKDGNLLRDLVDEIRVAGPDGATGINLGAITTKRLDQIAEASRPAQVVAGDVVRVEQGMGGLLGRLVEGGYEYAGRMTGFLGKNNIFYANYLDARKASQGYQKVLADDLFEQYANKIGLDLSNAEKVAKVRAKTDAAAAQQVTAQAARTAEMQTLAYVDNPDIRSQASVVLRNIIPFGRAQEEFYRRWGRTIRHNPDAIRRLQMLNEGAHHSGFIQKDEEGNDIFIYPASRPTQELMYRLGKLRGWNWAMSPVPYQMSSQVRFLNQGMDPKNILPSFGPVAAIPMKSVEKVLPESVAVRSFNRRVLGDQAANQKNPFASVLPTFARRLYESGIFGNDSEQLASAMKQSAVYLEMAGRTPPEGADPGVIEAHEDDLRTWARVHLFMRAIFGTVAPASPQEFGAASGAPIGDHTTDDPAVFLAQHQLIDAFRQKGLPTVSSEFRAEVARLLPQHGPGAYDVALANWVRTRPDQLPFTVGTSEAEFGGFIPATKAAGDFFDNNRALFKNYRAAAVLFLPQSEGEFSLDVHRAQMGAGLRKKKDFEEFALDLKLVGNLQTYYDQKEAYAAKRAEAKAAGNLDAARAIDAAWTDAAKRIKLTHPALGQYLDNYQERQNNRNRVMSELSSMIENNDMPDIPGRQAIAMMVDAYQKRQSALAQLAPQRTDEANAAKAAIKSSFQDYVKRVAATDLNADMVYQRLLRGLEED